MTSSKMAIITVLSDDDDDDDGSLTVSDEMLSFGFLDEDDVMRHQKNDGVMTIKLSPLMTPPLNVETILKDKPLCLGYMPVCIEAGFFQGKSVLN